jgi:hypothetical protein
MACACRKLDPRAQAASLHSWTPSKSVASSKAAGVNEGHFVAEHAMLSRTPVAVAMVGPLAPGPLRPGARGTLGTS